MKRLKQLNFETHAHMKNIIGQDMINDDNIAVKELIKNSIDANATKASISFLNTKKPTSESIIIIQDNGSGMSLEDIEQKWLNMAYSSKKEDNDRIYAGNKGIGRFSSDRLGGILELYTKQEDANEVIKLHINWGLFENKPDWREKINLIKFESYSLPIKDFLKETGLNNFTKGTYLKISEPRYPWSEDKLRRLKKDLEKFMIPKQVQGGESFSLFLNISGYDQNTENEISGEINNQIFDKLPFKTSHIRSHIDATGQTIKTELFHRGELLVELVEKNKFKHLKNTSIILFYLNPYHKAFFKRETGIHSVDYGSVFLYLNGFRVPPYGENENDWLGVDRRHGQGYRRYLGLRELIGRIELHDHSGKTYEVTSDREGIKRNDAFIQLKDISDGYFGHILKKLEKFIVDGLSWDSSIEVYNDIEKRVQAHAHNFDNFETNYQHTEAEKEKNLILLLDAIIFRNTNKEDTISLNFGKKAFDIINRQREEDIQKLLERLNKYKVKIENDDKAFQPTAILIKTIKKAQTELKHLKQEIDYLKKDKTQTYQKLEISEKRRLFAEAHITSDEKKLKEVIHLTGHWGKRIDYSLENIIKILRTKPEIDASLISELESTQILSTKITKLSRIITKANFALMSDKNRLDIFAYISEYTKEIKDLGAHITKVKISFSNPKNHQLLLNMSALEVSMLIDNIVINAENNNAKNLEIIIEKQQSCLRAIFKNDGDELTDKFPPESLFKAGITTTKGAGMGLFHVHNIAKKLESNVFIKNNKNNGISVILEWQGIEI